MKIKIESIPPEVRVSFSQMKWGQPYYLDNCTDSIWVRRSTYLIGFNSYGPLTVIQSALGIRDDKCWIRAKGVRSVTIEFEEEEEAG